MRHIQSKSLYVGLLSTLLLTANAVATVMEVPDPPPDPPPCVLGQDDPICPHGTAPFLYKAVCPDSDPKTICIPISDPIPVYMTCESYGDGADCQAKPDGSLPGTLTYTWTKSGRVAMFTWGDHNENASFACSTTRGVASVTLTVSSTNGSSGTQTIYLSCSP